MLRSLSGLSHSHVCWTRAHAGTARPGFGDAWRAASGPARRTLAAHGRRGTNAHRPHPTCPLLQVTATCGFLMIYLVSDCRPYGNDPTDNPIQMYCNDGEYHVLGAIWFQTPEQVRRRLDHPHD